MLIIMVLMSAYFLLDLNHHLSLKQFKHHLSGIKHFSQLHPILTPLILTTFYTAIVAIPTPLAASVCIIAGFLFPLTAAIIYASIAETLGSLILLHAVGTTFGQRIQQSSSTRIQMVVKNMRTSATLYIITLRLLCVFPSAIINIAAGLVKIPTSRYAIITFFSSLPAAFVFSLFGRGVEKTLLSEKPIHAGDLFTPPIIIMLIVFISLTIAAHLYQRHRKK